MLRNLWLRYQAWQHRDPDDWVNALQFLKDRIREEARDRRPDDAYSRRYMQAVRRRILTGKSPSRTLVESRAALVAFSEAVRERTSMEAARARTPHRSKKNDEVIARMVIGSIPRVT